MEMIRRRNSVVEMLSQLMSEGELLDFSLEKLNFGNCYWCLVAL